MKATEANDSQIPAGPIWPLLLGIILPTFITWIYFDLLSEHEAVYQKLAAGLGKCFQFALPIIAFSLRPKQCESKAPQYGKSAGVGLGFGFAVAAVMLTVYLYVMLPNALMDEPRKEIAAKVKGMGLDTPVALMGLGVFYSLLHSGMEEYYWRWFIFRELNSRISLGPAAIIGGLGFMSHHVIVLAKYFGWTSPLTWFFSLSIAVGGAAWALIYKKWGTLLGPWLSHLLVDAAIFIIGYHLLFVIKS